MKNWRIWAAFGAAILLAAGGIYAAYLFWLADPVAGAVRDGERAIVQRGRLVATVKAGASVAVPTKKTLTFGIGGRIVEIRVAEGDTVRAGDTLAKLDTADLELQVARAEAALALSKAQLARTQTKPTEAEINAAKEALAAAEARYERVKSGPLSAEIASAEAALRSAEANYEELRKGPSEDQRKVLQANVERAQIALQQAQAEYDKVSWRPGAQGSPQAAALQKATVDYQQALASYNLAIAGPTPDQIQKAEAAIAQAKAQLERLRTTGSADELRAAAAQVAKARADLEKLQNMPLPQELAIAQAQVEQANLALRQAKRQMDDATLVAPMAGTVLTLNANVGQTVSAATPIITMADLSKLQIQANVHEAYIGKVKKGQRALVTLEAFSGQMFEAQVSDIAPLPSTTGGMATFMVTLDLSATQLPVRPGMSGQAEIIISEKDNVLCVPKSALRLKEGRWMAQVLRDGKWSDVEVKIGERQERTIEVLEGLAEGDQVLLHIGSPAKEER